MDQFVVKTVTVEARSTTLTPANSAPLQILHPTPATVAPPPLQILHPTPATVAPITINEPSIEPSKETKKKKAAEAASTFVLPDWINKKHWDAWNSSACRKKITDEQKALAVEKLNAWRLADLDYATALENAAVGGWKGIFKPSDQAFKQATGKQANTSKYSGAAKAIWGDNNDLRTINA